MSHEECGMQVIIMRRTKLQEFLIVLGKGENIGKFCINKGDKGEGRY